MPAGLTSTIVVNIALQFIATQETITSLTDGSAAANYASVIYAPTVQLMLREIEPDFARTTVALTAAGVATPITPWAYEYLYPADMVRLRQVRPPPSGAGSLVDPYNPQAVRAMVDFDIIATLPTKVILTNQQNARAVYTSSTVTEAQWDPVFTDAVARRLANPLSMALAGRPDFAESILMQSAQMAQTAENVDDSGFRR